MTEICFLTPLSPHTLPQGIANLATTQLLKGPDLENAPTVQCWLDSWQQSSESSNKNMSCTMVRVFKTINMSLEYNQSVFKLRHNQNRHIWIGSHRKGQKLVFFLQSKCKQSDVYMEVLNKWLLNYSTTRCFFRILRIYQPWSQTSFLAGRDHVTLKR